MSLAETLQDSKVRDLRFFNGFRWRNPEFDTREFETFRETNPVNPAGYHTSGFKYIWLVGWLQEMTELNSYRKSTPVFCLWGSSFVIDWGAWGMKDLLCSWHQHQLIHHHISQVTAVSSGLLSKQNQPNSSGSRRRRVYLVSNEDLLRRWFVPESVIRAPKRSRWVNPVKPITKKQTRHLSIYSWGTCNLMTEARSTELTY